MLLTDPRPIVYIHTTGMDHFRIIWQLVIDHCQTVYVIYNVIRIHQGLKRYKSSIYKWAVRVLKLYFNLYQKVIGVKSIRSNISCPNVCGAGVFIHGARSQHLNNG